MYKPFPDMFKGHRKSLVPPAYQHFNALMGTLGKSSGFMGGLYGALSAAMQPPTMQTPYGRLKVKIRK